ncbi:MAG: hypothetical protein GY723_15040 [bacterium]|nr:hypothetical protein [bacterium]MCP5066234.1 hypothetical protein [bacterium]
MTDPFDRSRRHRRVSVHVPVHITTIDPETDPRTGHSYFRDTREYAANVSRGGAFIRTNDPPSPGQRVLVQIHVPDEEPVEAIGRIAWTKRVIAAPGEAQDEEAGAGIEFIADSGKLEEITEVLDLPADER